jgi:hypothetical protein
MNNPDHISESLETIFWVKILKFFDADPGWKKFGSGRDIPDPQHCKIIFSTVSMDLFFNMKLDNGTRRWDERQVPDSYRVVTSIRFKLGSRSSKMV